MIVNLHRELVTARGLRVDECKVDPQSPIGLIFQMPGTYEVVIRRRNGDETTWTRLP